MAHTIAGGDVYFLNVGRRPGYYEVVHDRQNSELITMRYLDAVRTVTMELDTLQAFCKTGLARKVEGKGRTESTLRRARFEARAKYLIEATMTFYIERWRWEPLPTFTEQIVEKFLEATHQKAAKAGLHWRPTAHMFLERLELIWARSELRRFRLRQRSHAIARVGDPT